MLSVLVGMVVILLIAEPIVDLPCVHTADKAVRTTDITNPDDRFHNGKGVKLTVNLGQPCE